MARSGRRGVWCLVVSLAAVLALSGPGLAAEPDPPADGGGAAPAGEGDGNSGAEGGSETPPPEPEEKPKPPPPPVETGPPKGASKAEVVAWEAGKLVDEGALKAAEAKANLAISVDGNAAAGRYQLARIRVREGRIIEAYQQLKQAVSKQATHAPSHMLLMRVSLMGGQTPTAEVQALDRVVANNPDDLLLKMALAEGYLATNQPNQAIKEARKVLKKAETSVGAMKLLARAYFASKRVAAAEAIIRRTRDIRPDAEASFILARIRMQQKRMISARDLLEEAVKIKPDYVEALNNLGMVYIKVRNYGAAEDAITKAIAMAPAFAEAFLNLGAAQRGSKRFEAAEKSWLRVLKIKPQMADAHYNLGILYLENKLPGRDRIKQLTEAIKQFTTYKQSSSAAATDKNVDKYLGEAKLLIKQEQQRRKEELKQVEEDKKAKAEEDKRKAEEAKKKAEEAKKKADDKPADGDPSKDGGDGGEAKPEGGGEAKPDDASDPPADGGDGGAT